MGLAPEQTAPLVLRLLGLSEAAAEEAALTPEAVNVRTREVLRQMAIQSSRRRPLVLAVEDIQWIDSASDALLTSLIESLGGARILIIVTYRPGHVLPWIERSYVTSLSLQALGSDDCRALLEGGDGAGARRHRSDHLAGRGQPVLHRGAGAVTEQGSRAVQVRTRFRGARL
jgi:hypothetical protein